MTSPRVRKAVIPAAGLGTRFLPATKAVPKSMLPVVDKPAVQYVVEEAVAAGIDDIVIVIGRGKTAIVDHFDRSFELEHALEASGKFAELEQMRALAEMADIHYIRQGQPRGLGHAVSVARSHVGNEPFAVLLEDDMMDPASGHLQNMLALYADNEASVVAVKKVEPHEVSLYGCIEPVDADGGITITSIVEKPAPGEAPSDLCVMGRYVFTPEIFDALERTTPGRGGEIQLTDAIALLIDKQPVYAYAFETGRFDVGNKLDYLRATVEIALERPDLANDFRSVLYDIVDRERAKRGE
ncbi:MAG TPA: UTP--glucose-1-phosphate uridylyltransferase GalU [Acidimicrobiales bacterium]|nr:UTP--glucose-1-phosphate uridylyltransferase GalU [Acidimicrobiales bacterium]